MSNTPPTKHSTVFQAPTPPDKSLIVDPATLEAYIAECLEKLIPCHVIELPSSQFDALVSPSEDEYAVDTSLGRVTLKRTPA